MNVKELQDFIGVEKALLLSGEEKKLPVNGSLELLPLCNMNCRMCYVRLSKEEQEAAGPLLPLSEWLRIAEEMKASGVLFLMLSGGEPLLYSDFKELYLQLRKMGFVLTVNTNGTLLNEEWADFFAANRPRRINLTLYGMNEQVYEELCGYRAGFEKAKKALQLLTSRRIPVKVNYSAVPENSACLYDAIGFCQELSVPINADTYMQPGPGKEKIGRLSPEEAAEFQCENLRQQMGESAFRSYGEELSKKEIILPDTGAFCMAGNCSFNINWQGALRPCTMFREVSVSLKEQSFSKAWQLLRAEMRKPMFPEKCRSCEDLAWCKICPASAERETGELTSVPELLCSYATAFKVLLKNERFFSIRNLCFGVHLPEALPVPENFLLFEDAAVTSEYHYYLRFSDGISAPDLPPLSDRGDVVIYSRGKKEIRLLRARGQDLPYALYEELTATSARVLLDQNQRELFHLDTVFSSLFALEKRALQKGALLFHCTYLSFREEAILFTGPSGMGKSTQGGLWEQYRNAEVINGDRCLLSLKDGKLTASGFPVCGSSEICKKETLPVKAIVSLEQAPENRIEEPKPQTVFSLLYPQITVNTWDRKGTEQAMALLSEIIESVPVYRLFCTISEDAVNVLYRKLYEEKG